MVSFAKVGIVTGGSKGIGKAIAEGLAREGCRVAICARDGNELARAAGEIQRSGGTAFAIAFYGTDQYITQYDYEIGPPWKAFDTYVKISYPFLHADRIKTPTLFLGGERDFNVPVQGGQQMYQALKSLGIDTQLIIYPNETHGIQRPGYQRDRLERYVAWYDKYLKKK